MIFSEKDLLFVGIAVGVVLSRMIGLSHLEAKGLLAVLALADLLLEAIIRIKRT